MQISTSLFFARSTSQMAALSAHADTLQAQISTTKKYAAPSDNIIAYQRLQGIARTGADASAYATNVQLAQTLLGQSDATLESVLDQVQRAQELAVQAGSDTFSDSDRASIAVQLRAILDDLVNLANTTDARGQPLFGAGSAQTGVTRATDGSVGFAGSGDPIAIPVSDTVSIQPTDSAERVFGGIAGAGGPTDVFAIIGALADTLENGGDVGAAAATALGDLKASVDHLTGVRASIGARGARLDLEQTRAADAGAAREIDRSAIEDTDITAAITELQKTMTILQATQASFTQLTQLSLFNYIK
ncbi:flagellar hook-associated protein 3 FlgL [Hephaestia caeni]|uniref:Flagellin n=1 Tax=Hephaestia caeni TaxID=645617 RepID=A0A397PFN6_9SPHN|nr:flagellin [Hephaestia caeni]RIA44491.1 flagellar hook-associated protein 3 FlgL [Hephaestia caeni]